MIEHSEEEILGIVYRAIDAVNPQLPPERRVEKSPDEALFGREGKLDSLGLVNLVVAVEQELEDALGVSLTLADEKALSERSSPFRTVSALSAYVRRRLEERPAGG